MAKEISIAQNIRVPLQWREFNQDFTRFYQIVVQLTDQVNTLSAKVEELEARIEVLEP